jgi:hypothetical protein
MKRLPPPNNKPTKANGSNALARVDYFERFQNLVEVYDNQVEARAELGSANSSRAVRILRDYRLSPISDEERGDSLQKLWPSENIYAPSRGFYVHRLALLVDSFPSAAPHSPKIYTHMLVSHVAMKCPSCMVLESACIELVNTHKYATAPNIADLISLLGKHEKLWEKRLEIDREIQSGRARERAEGCLAYEEEYEQRKVKSAITSLMKLKLEMRLKSSDPMMLTEIKRIKTFAGSLIVRLREDGINALDEDEISELQNDARRLQEQDRDQDPDFIAILAFLEPFKLYRGYHDPLAEAIYREGIPARVVDAVANGIPPDTRLNIIRSVARGENSGQLAKFREITFKALHAMQHQQEAPS